MTRRTRRLLILTLLMVLAAGCTVKARTPAALIYKEAALGKPGSYRFQLFPDGQGTLEEYLARERAGNPALDGLDVPGLTKLRRNAFPELYLPVQPGVPLCNLDTSFNHCKGIELAADFELYGDDTVVLQSQILYHVRLRLEGINPISSGPPRRSAIGAILSCRAISMSAPWWWPSRRPCRSSRRSRRTTASISRTMAMRSRSI